MENIIEKALKWYCLDCECNNNCKDDCNCFFKDSFKRYLEGNENSLPPKIYGSVKLDETETENYHNRHLIRRIKDMIVKKAVSWLDENTMSELCMNCEDRDLVKEFIESFKKHMEDSKNDLPI
jgi:hypothetical protein